MIFSFYFLHFKVVTSMELVFIDVIGKEDLDYYVIYDFHDNIIAYCDNLDELSKFTNRLKKHLKYEFKNRDVVYYFYENTIRRIYKFLD